MLRKTQVDVNATKSPNYVDANQYQYPVRNYNAFTPLQYAAIRGHAEVVKVLLGPRAAAISTSMCLPNPR